MSNVTDIAEELVELGGSTSLEDRINHVLQRCHAMVRYAQVGLEWRRDERFCGIWRLPRGQGNAIMVALLGAFICGY